MGGFMSGSTIGGVVGGVVGFFFSVPQLGYVLGSAIGGAVDPEEIRGPSIGDAQRQTSQAGVPRPVVYGHPAPFQGNLIDGEAKARVIEQTEGGKGGPEVTTERFILTSAIRICEGPIAGVLKIWRNDQLVFDRTADGNFPEWSGSDSISRLAYIAAIRAKTNAFNERIAIYYGDETQLPDPTLEAIHGVGNTPYYRGTAYIVIKDDDVTDMRGAAAQWKFEVVQVGADGSAPVTTPNEDPAPTAAVAGSVSGAVEVTRTAIPFSPSATVAPLVHISTSVHSDWNTSAEAYAPSAGQDLNDGYAPARVVVVDQNGTAFFDSGWMGFPIQQGDLNIALQAAGMSESPIVSFPQDAFIQVPSGVTSWEIIVYRTDFFADFPKQIDSTGQIQIYFPDPSLLPASYYVTPEFPNALVGSDGNLYYPEWVTPPPLTTLTPGDVFLAPVVADIASRCNVPAANIDVSALAGEVIPGLLVAQQGPGADAILPTQRGFFYDFPEFDKKLRAVLRGAATVATITDDDLLDEDEQTRPQQVEYPRLVSVITQDPDANYAPVPQTSIRTSLEVEATNEITLPLAIPFRADTSKQIAEKLHKVLWAQAEGRFELPLPEKFSTLTPSDCFLYSGRRWLIERTNYADGQMNVSVAYDRANAYSSNASGQPAQPPELPSSGLGGPTFLQFLNLPILSDLDDRLGFYVAASGVSDGWRGATVQGRVNSSDAWTTLTTITSSTIQGALVTSLPDAVADIIDDENTVRVDVNGELSSITLEQLLNEQNGCVIGHELCQFQTATFVSEGVYDLSILTRGRLNTDPVLQPAGTRFVLLNAPVFVEAPTSWMGQTIELRAVTLGTSSDNAQVVSVVWDPVNSQTEWPPVQFLGTRDSSNNVSISWVGQGRLGSNMNATNSQNFLHYQVTITKGSSVVYTTTSQSFPYSAAQQIADFGSATGTLTVSISAVNRFTGAGEALTGSIP